jgi:DNA repair protein RadA/Sms
MRMAKSQQHFVCDACGYESPKWMGKCPRCSGWDTMKETRLVAATEPQTRARPVFLTDGEVEEERILLGIEELDRVLGGGLTRGSSVLLGGDPGIGKTTLCFEMASRVVELGLNALYVSGEESPRQLAGRKRRLALAGTFPVLSTNQVDDILDA